MRPKLAPPQRGDTTLLDIMAILAAVAVVAIVVLPMIAKSRAKPSRINCVNNLKQIALSSRVWALDHNDKYPMQVSTHMGGTTELVDSGAVWPHFAVMSNELSTPKLLCCPDDSQRTPVADFTSLRNTNISYFVVPEAKAATPGMWLAGDRNLATNTVPLKPGLFTVTPNRVMRWTAEQHINQGNLAFADASVQQVANADLQRSASNALRAYFVRAYIEATTNTTFRTAIP